MSRRVVLEVVEKATDQPVHEVDVTMKSPRQRDRVRDGMEINIDRKRYRIRLVTKEGK